MARRERAPVPEIPLECDPPPRTGPILPPRRTHRRRQQRLTDYRAQIARMDAAQLADEQRKGQRTMQQFPAAHWVAEIRARLRLVAEELRRRQAKSSPRQAKSPPPSTVPAAAQISIFDVLGEITLRRSPGSVGIAQARASP